MKHIALALGVLASSSIALAEKKPYSLADLKALVAQKSFKEAVEHLKDVSPSERTADWQAVAADAAAGYIGSLKDDNLVTKVLEIEKVDSEYPTILKSAKYTKVRGEVGLKAYKGCFENSYWIDECLDHAYKFIEADTDNTDLAFKMGKLVRLNAKHWASLRYFKKALTAKNTKAMCADKDIEMAVLSGLALPASYDAMPIAKEVAQGPCWENLKKPIVEAFNEDSENGYVRTNACGFLKAKKALSAEQAKTCKSDKG
jgi:hypothetical protein